jgi:hypothetical protein
MHQKRDVYIASAGLLSRSETLNELSSSKSYVRLPYSYGASYRASTRNERSPGHTIYTSYGAQKSFFRNYLQTPLRKRKSRSGVVLELTRLTTDFMYNLPEPYEMSSIGCFYRVVPSVGKPTKPIRE